MRVIVHPLNEDSYVGEIEGLPRPGEPFLKVSGPRTRDGKHLRQLSQGVDTILVPVHRINFIEVLDEEPSAPTSKGARSEAEEEEFAREPQILFYRD